MRVTLIALFTALTLGGCDSGSSASKSPTATDATADASPRPSPAEEDHNYDVHEDGAYGYTTAVSDDAVKAGQASGDVVMFRYLGQRHGSYVLQNADQPAQEASCTNPCEVVKLTVGGEVIERVEFNPKSVIGSALQDAFNGKLDKYNGSDKTDVTNNDAE